MSTAKFKVGDKVKILDGSKIEHYIGGWASIFMGAFVGRTATVRSSHYETARGWYYRLDLPVPGWNCKWDERGLQPVAAAPSWTAMLTRSFFALAV